MYTGKKLLILFIGIFLLKLTYVVFINHHFKHEKLAGHVLATAAGDTPTYIEPIENLIKTGSYGMWMSEYTPFLNKENPEYFTTIRTPHYGFFYLFFRLFTEPKMALDLIVLLQLAVEALAILAFSKMIYEITFSKLGYGLALFFLVASSWITFYAGEIVTESLTCSFLLFGFVFYHKWLRGKKNLHLILSGLFIAYAIMMKPFLLPYIVFLVVSIRIHKKGLKKAFKPVVLFCLPLFLLMAPWILRNYLVTKQLVIFSKPMYYPCKKLVSSCGVFLAAWGGDPTWWEGKCRSAGTFFFPVKPNFDCEYVFPENVYTPDYTLSDFRELRSMIMRFQTNKSNDSLDNYIASRFVAMTASYRKYHPFDYYFLAPVMRMKNAFIKSGSYYINPTSTALLLHKISQTLLYWFPLVLGSIGLLFLGLPMLRNPMNLVLVGLPLSLIVVLNFALKLNEWRYFIHTYPILVYYMILLTLYIRQRWVKRKAVNAGLI